jgi:PST family polysaccharide transporter
MKDNQRVLYNFIVISASSAVNLLLPILLIPHFIAKLGIELFGTITIAQTLMSYMTVIIDFHFSIITVREISVNRAKKNYLNQIFNVALFTRLILLFFCVTLVTISAFLYPPFKTHEEIILYSSFIIIGQALIPNWFLLGVENVLAMAALNIAFKIAFLFLCVVYVNDPTDAVLPNLFLGITNCGAGIVGIIYIQSRYQLQIQFPNCRTLFKEIKRGLLMTTSNVSTSIYNSSSPVILALFTTPKVVGEYAAAERVISLFRSVSSIYFQATYPRVAKLMLKGNIFVKQFYKETYTVFLLAVICGTAVFSLATHLIMSTLFHLTSDSIAEFSKFLMIAFLINCFNIPYYQRLLLTKPNLANYVIIPGCLLSIILNFCLVPLYGAYGCITAIVITEIYVLGNLYYQNRKLQII